MNTLKYHNIPSFMSTAIKQIERCQNDLNYFLCFLHPGIIYMNIHLANIMSQYWHKSQIWIRINFTQLN